MSFKKYVMLLNRKSHILRDELRDSLLPAETAQLVKVLQDPKDETSNVMFHFPPITKDTPDFRRDLIDTVRQFARLFAGPRTCWDNSKDWETRQKECSYLAQLLVEAEKAQEDAHLITEVQWIVGNKESRHGYFVGDTQLQFYQKLSHALKKCHDDERYAQTTPVLVLRKQDEIIETAAYFSRELKLVTIGQEAFFLEEALLKHGDNPAQVAAITQAFALAMIENSKEKDRAVERQLHEAKSEVDALAGEASLWKEKCARQERVTTEYIEENENLKDAIENHQTQAVKQQKVIATLAHEKQALVEEHQALAKRFEDMRHEVQSVKQAMTDFMSEFNAKYEAKKQEEQALQTELQRKKSEVAQLKSWEVSRTLSFSYASYDPRVFAHKKTMVPMDITNTPSPGAESDSGSDTAEFSVVDLNSNNNTTMLQT